MDYEIHVRNSTHSSSTTIGPYPMLRNITVYTIEGHDEQGPIKAYRKQSEFVILRKLLQARWPGLPLPLISSQNLVISDPFQKDTRDLLELFLRGLMKLDFIVKSELFQWFVRGNDNFEELSVGLKLSLIHI